MDYASIDSPVGPLTIAGDDNGLHSIAFSVETRADPGSNEAGLIGSVIQETIRQLQAYFEKKLFEFDVPLNPEGTPFQMEVWRELRKIPYGKVISYGELARRIGNPKASRAVGAANGSNPIPIIIPCHRVIGNNGKLIGYGGGVPIKEALLRLENARLF